ncbi:DNA helicase RecQ [Deinococcus misasensis]|uniref:DNA helicase RecQ n=1 Tax=Deinococcus misasensis TaxID=392413 RepID=UPI0005555F7B|nr:DNA helicase RecQ [Deinococcus misasensis]
MQGDVLLQARSILQRVWGYDQFRGIQEEIVRTVAQGQHALVLMPTGGGKSLCYQLPSLLRPGVGIVISPLIALMKDQVDTLRQLGVQAAYLNSTLSPSASRAVEQALQRGQLDLLYIAPERLLLPRTLELLHSAEIALFAVDEAHCVSQWGHDFRPEYQQLHVLEKQFPQVPRLALTATADERTRADIRQVLSLQGAPEFLSSFDRPNITYRVATKERPRQQLLDFIQSEHPGDAGVVYCLSRRSVEETALWLQEQGLEVVAYHAGLSQAERSLAQERFLNEEGIIVVATVAFGMGIDKPNVRFVAHLDLPKSLEGYYQETGRAGRDGLPSTAWMVYGLQDVVNVRRMLQESDAPEEVKRVEASKLTALLTYCETAQCRRQILLGYFGETYTGPCGNCDVCLNPPTVRDMTREAQMALSAAVRTGNRYGAAYLIDILLGKENDKNSWHRTLPTYGIGKEHDAKVWGSVIRQLVSLGYLTAGPFQGLMTTPQAKMLLTGAQRLLLREDTLQPRTSKRTREKVQATRAVVAAEDKPLFEALRNWRAERAAGLKVPPYVIFSDATLKAIAELRPDSLQGLGKVSGIGERRLADYGEEVLRIVGSGTHEGPSRPRGTVQAHELGLGPARAVLPEPRHLQAQSGPNEPSPESLQSSVERSAYPVEVPTPARMDHVQADGVVVSGGAEEAPPEGVVSVALGDLRRALARETGHAAYMVFPNATLTALAARLPRTMSALEGIPGLGPRRIEQYGERILEAITTALGTSTPIQKAASEERRPSATVEVQDLPGLLERIARDLRSGRVQVTPFLPERVLQELSAADAEFSGWHVQEQEGVITLVLRVRQQE